ncbi:Glycosyl hydrolases family 16 [Mesonia phycicola]|uniref:Glycosyl hydrolases family 16 n=1 Tax=Mesonia phycicola TaxID=579105 RepID=A0A1M6G4P1_9FLAO|nr:glycoside hydrolase family 16 protein [Mesonia phycicola]SHJ04852.1 Glycosyl hydrolases family 16 [Mesonia phycicola]
MIKIKNFQISTLVILLCFVSLQAQEQKQLIWEESFAGDSINLQNWNYELGDGCPNLCGWGNNERQIYHKDYVEVKDGMLIITANKVGDVYYSGKINSKNKFEFKYGTAEIRAKVPGGRGLWPAIWMLGSNITEVGWPAAGEIDIMEFVGKQPDTLHTTLHTPDSFGNSINTKITKVENIINDFHTYKIDWNEDAIVFYIDNKKVYTFSPKVKNDKTYPYNQPFYFLLNMAVGGKFGGPEVDESIFPERFYIDYIRVYQ